MGFDQLCWQCLSGALDSQAAAAPLATVMNEVEAAGEKRGAISPPGKSRRQADLILLGFDHLQRFTWQDDPGFGFAPQGLYWLK